MTWLHVVVDVPSGAHDSTADFWGRALGWPVGEPWTGHPELSSFKPPSGSAYVHLQQIDGPSRVHLDVEAPDPGAAITAAQEAGAAVVARHDEWTTMNSPGGLPFCFLREGGRTAPPPVGWPGGHRSRMVQVCIDSPAPVHEREVAFWRDLLGERWSESPAQEFAGKWHDDAGGPVQLLVQRLGEDHGPVRAHLDLGTDDVPAEVRRLVGLGATDVSPGRGWHVLRDPLGQVFCVTENDPEVREPRG